MVDWVWMGWSKFFSFAGGPLNLFKVCDCEEGALWKELELEICTVKRTQKCDKDNKQW